MPDGSWLASLPLSYQRLADYVDMAENNRIEFLIQKIDENTQDHDRHPNQIILAAVMFLAAAREDLGKSSVPLLRMAAKSLGGETLVKPPVGLWTPGGKIV